MRRALLLGNPGDGLTGVHADIAAMSALLARHAFTAISPLIGGTRAEILAAIRDLIKNSEPGDAAVLYYSGHGWRLEVPGDRRRDGGLGEFQGISPADVARTTAGDFRGILADELTALTDELTEKTANVTVILDCCHATNIVRGGATPRAGVRATPVPWKLTHAEFVASLRAQGLARPRRDPEVNPLAVRLLACRPHQQAGEDPRAPGGLLTRALAAVLAECDHGELVWEDVGRRVDAWVRSIKPSQNPIVVGPARRYMFSLDVRATTGTTACVTRDDVVWISGGALLDHRPGDRFVALSPIPDAPALARLEVTDVHHQLARATSTRPLPDGATVQQVGWASPRAAVALTIDTPRRALIAAAIAATGRLTISPSEAPTIAEVREAASGLEIRDREGLVVRGAATLEQTCAVLTRMAQAEALRRLTSVAPLDPDTIDIAWSLVGAARPLVAGEIVPSTAHVTAVLRNRGVVPLFATLFAAEADGRVTLLTRSQPGGVELMSDGEYRLGEDRLHGVRGAPLCGPSMRPSPGRRPVTLISLVLEAPVPLGAWEVAPMARHTRGEALAVAAPGGFPEHPIRYSVAALDLIAEP
jgi:hypothetical protein